MSHNQILEYLRTFIFDLPAVQKQYEALRTQTEALRLERNAGSVQRREIESQINTSGETLRTIIDAIKEGQNEKWELDRQKTELKRFVTKFRDTDQGYREIIHIVKTKVKMILKDKSRLLDLAVISVINSLGTHKDKCKYLFELLDLEIHGRQNREEIGWDYSSNTMRSTPLTQYKSNPFLFSKGLLGAQSIGYGKDPNAQRYKDDIVKMSEWFYERLAQDLTVDILKQLESSDKSTYI